MIRRLGLVPGVLAATSLLTVAGLSSCDKFEPNEAAATVNGYEISLDQLDELAEGNDDPAVLRAALTAWIQVVAVSDDPGELLTEDALAAQRDVIIPPLIEATQAQAQSQYEQGLQGSSVLCMAVIPLAADVESATVLDALDEGVPFAELAAQFSEDPSLVETGGIIAVNGQECLPTDQWNADLIAQLTEAEITVGEPGVIILNDSEVVVLLRPYDELTPESKTLLAQGPVSEALLALYQAADVTVHESIGTWDSEQGLVVASSSDE
ncbi:MAG: peptidyl-prolyl cis-trans isomerase [Actinomycetia bacterium]|nr:peptidyl-prolyl cis-trans isomerase [Actinomycetes bacterium]